MDKPEHEPIRPPRKGRPPKNLTPQQILKQNEERVLHEVLQRTEGQYEPVLVGSHKKPGEHTVKYADRRGQGVPKRIEALYILTLDTKVRDRRLPLTLFELETNPKTAHFPKEDKEAMVKYWPAFKYDDERVEQIREERNEVTRTALKADRAAARIVKANGLDVLKISDQLDSTAKIYNNQIFKTALAIGASDTDDVLSNPLLKELDTNRIKRLKDLIHISRNLADLAARIREADDSSVAEGQLSDEADQMLKDADAMLLSRGIQIDVSGT